MTFHHKDCGGELVNDPGAPPQVFGPYGEIQLTAIVQPQKCSKCGFRMPLNIDWHIEETLEDVLKGK